MLNYEIHMEPQELEILEADLKEDLRLANPFPGLRPFGVDECHLFFGREGQVDEILVKLSQNRFVGVMGYSGSGKSSLMSCGLIPVLLGGFMTEVGPNWSVITTRPGIGPIDNLAAAILEKDPDYQSATEEERLINKTITSSILRGSSTGLIDVARRYNLATGENLLLVVDQFEELFRYREDENIAGSQEESTEFVNLLLQAISQKDVPIYVALTMRSDYIGDCSQFTGLTEQINESNYLVPQMSREQKRMAVEGPVAVGGARIAERLVKRLLNDVGDSQDQLPILQHALMRTWNYWVENKEPGEPLDIRHYNAVGRIGEALSQHANEAYDDLEPKEKEIAEILFKTITEKGADNFGVRRPTKIGVISDIAGVEDEVVIGIVEKFRKPGRSLLMPPASVPLTSESVIEVSHESLMRIWTRLKNWVEEEDDSAQMYMRLSDAAAMYQIGRTGLWRPPDLQLALNWQKKQKPTRVWAQRYDEAFERAIVFLDTSRITYEAEQKNQELQQRRLLKRTRMVAIILAIAAVIAIIFFIFGITQQIEAENQAIVAQQQRDEAVEAREDAERQRERAQEAQEDAENNAELARQQKEIAQNALNEAIVQRQIAERQTIIAKENERIADSARVIAEEANRVAQQQTEEALRQYDRAQRLLFLSIAQSMSVKSLNIGDDDLKGLLAQQAYMFNTEYQGKEFDTYIYDGLYYSMAQIVGDRYNKYEGHQNTVRTVAFSPASNNFYSAGSDGKILQWTLNSEERPTVIAQNGFPNRKLEVSPDDRWLVNASDSSQLEIYDLQDLTKPPVRLEGHRGLVYDIAYTPDNAGFYSVGLDNTIRFNDVTRSRLVKNIPGGIKVIDVSPDGTMLAAGGLDGKVRIFNTQSFEEQVLLEVEGAIIQAITFSKDGALLAIGDEQGVVKLIDVASGQIRNELTGQTARVNDLEFSKDDKLLASASWDGSVYLWVLGNLDDLPIIFKDHDSHIWDVDFSADGNYLIAGSTENIIKAWPTNPKIMAEKLCENIDRNMTEKEWERYVGNDIEYRSTCASLSLSEK